MDGTGLPMGSKKCLTYFHMEHVSKCIKPILSGGLKKFGTIYVGVLAFNFLRERKSQSLQTQEQDNYKKTKQLPVPTAVKEGRKQDVSTVSTQNGIKTKFGRYR